MEIETLFNRVCVSDVTLFPRALHHRVFISEDKILKIKDPYVQYTHTLGKQEKGLTSK